MAELWVVILIRERRLERALVERILALAKKAGKQGAHATMMATLISTMLE